MDNEQPTDVVPVWCMQILMLAWLVLLGGRWISTPFIMFGDPSVADTISSLDRGPLLRCYLVLLLLTLTVLALRFARSIEQWIEQMKAASKSRGVRSNVP